MHFNAALRVRPHATIRGTSTGRRIGTLSRLSVAVLVPSRKCSRWGTALAGAGLAAGPIAAAVATLTPTASVERLFSERAGLAIARAIGLFTGTVHVSVAELCAPVLALVLLVGVWRARKRPLHLAVVALALISGGYAVFEGMWGLNYRRETMATVLQLNTTAVRGEEVIALGAALVAEANAARLATTTQHGIAALTSTTDDAITRAMSVYRAAGQKWPFLAGEYSRAKPLYSSILLSFAHVGGIYIPFTAEPNINVDYPAFTLPFTMLHEMAHQRGVAREDEANFIAWMVATKYGDADFRYSAALEAVFYAIRAVGTIDPDIATAQGNALSAGVRRDVEVIRAHQAKRESRAAEATAVVNDRYLRANGVAEGKESYGRVVDLMVATYREAKVNPLPLPQ